MSKRLRRMMLAVMALALPVTDAAADIKRSCYAGYRIELQGDSSLADMTKEVVVGRFKARRGCGHKGVANRCRRRARDGAHTCMKAHWDDPGALPAVCVWNGGQGVHDYPEAWGRLGPKEAARVEALSLCNYLSGPPAANSRATFCGRNMTVRVFATTRGDTGCAREVALGTLILREALVPGTFSARRRLSRPDIGTEGHKAQTIATRTFRYDRRIGGRLTSHSATSHIFATFDRATGRHLPFEPRYRDYYGCGRHAAQHMIDWMTRPESQSSFGTVSRDVSLTAHWFTDKFGEKAVIPQDLRRGMNRLLRRHGLGGTYKAVSHRNSGTPQNFILGRISTGSPVVALVQGGKHYMTAMGYWEEMLTDANGYFYTMDNGDARMKPWGDFSLKFSRTMKTFAATIPSYHEGVMLTWAAK